MKEIKRKQNIIKKMFTLLFSIALFSTSFLALTNTIPSVSINPLSTPTADDDMIFFSENFTTGVPPSGWTKHQTNPNQTWFVDYDQIKYPVSSPCATCKRGDENTMLDEWLITKEFNFSDRTRVKLNFYWNTCYYVTIQHRLIELNVSIQINGGAWITAWSFDDQNIPPANHFKDFTEWYRSIYLNQGPIDLTALVAGEDKVKIAFQFYSNDTEEHECQQFSIDDIEILVNSSGESFTCDANGPYIWCWYWQFEHIPEGIWFLANVTGATGPVQYQWSFGDGNFSKLLYLPTTNHTYQKTGTYYISLTATDVNTKLTNTSYTTVTLTLNPPPGIDLHAMNKVGNSKLYISLGIKARITNPQEYNAFDVNWSINVSSGIFKPYIIIANDTIDLLESKNSTDIATPMSFRPLVSPFLYVKIRAEPININFIERTYSGFKLGPLVILMEK